MFEDAGYRTFDEFCTHWKENHRILVQRRMLYHVAGNGSFADPSGIARSVMDLGSDGLDDEATRRRGRKGAVKGRKGRKDGAEGGKATMAQRLDDEFRIAEESGRFDGSGLDRSARVRRHSIVAYNGGAICS